MTSVLRQHKLHLLVSLLVLAVVNLRLFWLPGISFSSQKWDDENAWLEQHQALSILDFILQRDGAGYYILVPKILFVLAEITPNFGSIDSLRFLVILIQLACYAFAATCVFRWKFQPLSWLILFSTLSLTYIEDLNYLHNVGYLFIFPIYFLIFMRISNNANVPFTSVVLSALLICKPFTAVLTILLAGFYLWKKSPNLKLFTLIGYSIAYLILYITLPHGYETPFNNNVGHLLYVIVDLPWIFFTALLPAIYIGFFGLITVFDVPNLRLFFGVLINVLQLLVLLRYRKVIWNHFLILSLKSRSFLLILFSNYLLVFSSYDSFWVKNFPLYTFESPQFIWARWSAVIPLSALLFIASLQELSLRIRLWILAFIGSQWLLLMILGQQFLARYW
jgi:hypothetical protein